MQKKKKNIVCAMQPFISVLQGTLENNVTGQEENKIISQHPWG